MSYQIYPSRIWSIFNACLFVFCAFVFGLMAIRTPSALFVIAILFFLLAAFSAFVAGKLLWSTKAPVVELDESKCRFRNSSGENTEVSFSDIRRVEGYFTDQYLTGLLLTLDGDQTEVVMCGITVDVPHVFREIQRRSPHLRQLYSTVMVLVAIRQQIAPTPAIDAS